MQAVRTVASGGKFYRLVPDEENTAGFSSVGVRLRQFIELLTSGNVISCFLIDQLDLSNQPMFHPIWKMSAMAVNSDQPRA